LYLYIIGEAFATNKVVSERNNKAKKTEMTEKILKVTARQFKTTAAFHEKIAKVFERFGQKDNAKAARKAAITCLKNARNQS